MAQRTNLLEKLIGWIPGYRGYNQRETRRDTDRLVREAVVRQLAEPRAAVDAAVAQCSRTMDFQHLEALEGLRRRLTTVSDRVRHASSGYSGFFDAVKIEAAELDAIQEHDERLHEQAAQIAAAAAALNSTDSTETDMAARIAAVGKAIEAFEKSLRQRDDLLKGAE